ncbi:MAG: hypothetical protein IJQ93_14395, partial [Bacteroidales bacterium]|nr:hypothetical protein [Bacteroidales bacterium]
MKTPHLFLNGLLSSALLLTSCHFDFKDIDTSAISAEQTSTMDVDIRVKGRMVSSPSEATADEMAVSLFDIFIFRVSAEGHDLEYASTNNIPEFDHAVEGTSDRHIASLKVTLPSSGPKRVLVVANAQDNNLEYPEATTYDSFTSGIKFNFANGKTPGTPFLMTGQTLVASSTDARLFVTLGREAARMDVSSGNPGIVINRIGFGNAPRECWPFINNFAM